MRFKIKNYFYKYLILWLTIILTVLFHSNSILLFILLSVMSVLLLAIDNFKFIREYFTLLLFGTVTEILIINFSDGAWKYQINNVFGVPFWLMPLWGIAGVLSISIYIFFNKSK